MRTSPKRSFGKLLNAVAVAAALCASSVANAGVLNFETVDNGTLVFSGDVLQAGKYFVEGAGTAGLVGNIGTSDTCAAAQCPINNASIFYQALDDGYMFMSMANGEQFTLSSLDASFVGAGAPSYPALAALLYVTAFDAAGIVDEIYLDLAGPTSGNFSFANYDMSGFGGGRQFTEVRIASYACDAAGNCNRSTNQAQFAIDNITTLSASDVPEPGSFALMGLGLLGLRAASRRRAAVAI